MINLSRLKKENKRLQEKYDKLTKVCNDLLQTPSLSSFDSQLLQMAIDRLRLTLELHKNHGI